MTRRRFDQVLVRDLRDEQRQCAICHEYVAVIRDEEGTWVACSCDQNYLTETSIIDVDPEDTE